MVWVLLCSIADHVAASAQHQASGEDDRGLLNTSHLIPGAHLSEIGDLLRHAREKKNVSILEASDALRIKSSYLEALEDGDYATLPGPAYVTGFLRNYSSYLGLHPDDMVQEYYATASLPQPAVKAATRVLANGHQRWIRARLFWALGIVVLLLGGGFAIKEYNDTYDHAYSAPLLTPANLGATSYTAKPVHHTVTRAIHLRLRAISPVWVRVTADGRRVFQGILRGSSGRWEARREIYVATFDGTHLRVIYDGKSLGAMADKPGLTVYSATPSGWRHVA